MPYNIYKRLYKKTVCLICAIAVIGGCVFPIVRAVGTVKVSSFDFETDSAGIKTVTSGSLLGTQITSRTDKYNMNIWSISADSEDSENRVLKIKMSDNDSEGKTAQYRVGVMILNDGKKPYKLAVGTKYTITMRYKVLNGGTAKSGWLYFSQSPSIFTSADDTWGLIKPEYNAFGGLHNDETGKKNRVLDNVNHDNFNTGDLTDLNGNRVVKGEWITFAYTFTARGDITGGNDYLALAACATIDSEVYIDDICIAEAPAKAIAFDSNGGTHVNTVFGIDGDEIKIPDDPQKEGYDFAGWYTDKGFTERFAYEKWAEIGTSVVTAYARWEEAAAKTDVTFEDYPENWTYRAVAPEYNKRFSRLAALDTTVKPGETALRLSVNETLKKSDYTYFLLNNKENGLKTEAGKKYIVSFEYFADTVTEPLNLRAATADESNVWIGKKEYSDSTFTVTPQSCGKGWLKGNFIFTSYPAGEDGNLYDSLYILTSNYANPTVLYLDNICVREVRDIDCIAAIDPNNGESIIYKTGYSGDRVILPELDYNGHIFEGWSSNSYSAESNKKYEYTAGTVTVCAIWTPEGLPADANRDGALDIRDAVAVKEAVNLKKAYNDIPAADSDGNRKIENADIIKTLRLLSGTDTQTAGGRMSIGGTDVSQYKIVLPKSVSRVASLQTERLTELLNSDGGYSLNISYGASDESEYEILIGDTGRNTGVSKPEAGRYIICVKDKKLIIKAGDDEALAGTVMTLIGFYERCIERGIILSLNIGYSFCGNYYSGTDGYKYVWGDEFNGDELNRSLWVSSGESYKSDSVFGKDECIALKSEGCYVKDGNAVIFAEHDTQTNIFKHRQISTDGTHKFLYGCMEIRAKLSLYPGADALWFRSEKNSTAFQEIDLLENLDNPANIFSANLHYWGNNEKDHASLDHIDSTKEAKKYTLSGTNASLSDDYHIYSLEWNKDKITYCVDGKPFFAYEIKNGMKRTVETENGTKVIETGAETFRQACTTFLSTTMGSATYGPKWKAGDPDRVELLIDYIRLYQRDCDNGYSKETLKNQ